MPKGLGQEIKIEVKKNLLMKFCLFFATIELRKRKTIQGNGSKIYIYIYLRDFIFNKYDMNKSKIETYFYMSRSTP